MAGETLLLHADDSTEVLLFGRYVAAAAQRSQARVVLSVPPDLQRLMVGWTGVSVATAERPSHHRHCPFALLAGAAPREAEQHTDIPIFAHLRRCR